MTGLVFPPGFPTSSGAYQTACYTGTGGSFGCANQDAYVIKINPALSGAKSLVYATYLGGSANGGPGFTSFFAGEGNGIAVDASGDAYVTGFTESGDFPVKNPFLSGCPVNEADGCNAAFVTELNPQGSGLVYSTYLAGNGTPCGGDSAAAIAIDGSGKIYVTGMAQSTNFPVTKGAYKTAFPTTCPSGMFLGNCTSAFVTELNPALSGSNQLVYSTYLGGSGDGGYGDSGTGIALALGRIYVTGSTVSTNFPVTSSALLGNCLGCGTSKPNGAAGGDGFITVLDPTKTTSQQLYYSSYVGGSAGNDNFNAIATDSKGNAWLTGQAASTDFPFTSNAYQPSYSSVSAVFITEINPFLTGKKSLVYSTFVSGCCGESGGGIAVHDPDVFVTGFTASSNFPLTPDAAEKTCAPCLREDLEVGAFATVLNPTLTGDKQLVYSTFLVGNSPDSSGNGIANGNAIAVDAVGNFYVAGTTQGAGFLTTSNAFERQCAADCSSSGQNAFVAVFSAPSELPTPTASATPSRTPTSTPRRATSTPTPKPTPTHTPKRTATRTPTPRVSHTPTHTATRTPSPTHTARRTPTKTPTRTATHTPVRMPTHTATHTPFRTPSHTATRTPIAPSPTHTPTRKPATPTPSRTPIAQTPTPKPPTPPPTRSTTAPTPTPVSKAPTPTPASKGPTPTPGTKAPTPTRTPEKSPTATPTAVPILFFTAPAQLGDAQASAPYTWNFCVSAPTSGQQCGLCKPTIRLAARRRIRS